MTQPTQTRHPWRATLRTALAVALALAPVLPEVVDAAGLAGYGWAAAVLGVAAAVTRVLAIPRVNAVLREHVPWLAAEPRER